MTAFSDAAGRRFVTVLVGAALLGLVAPVRADVDPNYQLGVAAFRAGEYAQALERFEAAERSGKADVRLDFNLGSTLFKLGRYSESRARFERIANDPDWGPLALYNLGLIAEREGRERDARGSFEAVVRRAGDRRVAELARARLGLTDPAAPIAAQRRWSGLVSIAGGWDDNVVLSEDPAILAVSDQEDAFVQVLMSASRPVAGNESSGVRVDLNAFGEAYRDLDEFNVATLSPGLAWSGLMDAWSLDTGIVADAELVGSDYYATTGTLRVRASRALGGRYAVRIRADSSWIEGAPNFDYVTGWRERLGVELQSRYSFGRVRAGYMLELNARDDFETGAEFSSYSPTRHSLYVSAFHDPTDWLRLEARIEYRASDYSDANRILDDDGSLVIDQRDENRRTFSVRASFEVDDNLGVFVDYGHANNDANFTTFEYEQNRIMLGIERVR